MFSEVLGDHLLFHIDCQQLSDGNDFWTVRSQRGITLVTKSRLCIPQPLTSDSCHGGKRVSQTHQNSSEGCELVVG